MQGPTYFQAKSGPRKRAAPAVDTAELRAALAAGCRREALEKLPVKAAAQVQQLQAQQAEHFTDWRFQLRCAPRRRHGPALALVAPAGDPVLAMQAGLQPALLRLRQQEGGAGALWQGGLH